MLENVLTYLSTSISFFQLPNQFIATYSVYYVQHVLWHCTDIIWCLSHLWHLKISFYDITDFEIWIICNQTNKNVCKRALKWLWLDFWHYLIRVTNVTCTNIIFWHYQFWDLSLQSKKWTFNPLENIPSILKFSNGP